MRLNVFLMVSATLLLSCSDYKNSDSTPQPLGKLETPEVKMLLSIGNNVIAKGVQNFATHSELLKEGIEKYCGDQDPRSQKAAQDQWERTMLAYHFIDAASMGPIVDNNWSANIYSWPSLNTCGVDSEVAKLAIEGTASENLTANRKGLAALEYLLFEKSLSSRCNLVANALVKTWLDRSAERKAADRCQFAKFLVADLVEKASTLNQSWSPTQGNFTQSLVDGSRYKDTASAVNELTTSLFSLEKVKDVRLGAPLGLSSACTGETRKCPEMIEHPWSGIGLKAIVARLEGFRSVFLGGGGANDFGYDDYMAGKSYGDVAEDLKTRLDKSIANAQLLAEKSSMQDQVNAMEPARCRASTAENPLEPICALFFQVQEVATLFKTDVLTMLSIDNHTLTPGDND
jgi:predicted lipoprotein